MTGHVLDALFGVLGGLIPGGIHFAWNFTRNNKTTSGTIDLTLRKNQK
jgi:hypothetical protein